MNYVFICVTFKTGRFSRLVCQVSQETGCIWRPRPTLILSDVHSSNIVKDTYDQSIYNQAFKITNGFRPWHRIDCEYVHTTHTL